uniref:histidine kinase n=1 Tax=Cajanus cajan TaxID=3821 RepID=A0A151RK02_CAJCA|nr:Sensor protein rcsC [Cajanus cajan]
MVCEMESECIEDMDIEVLSSMWPEDIGTDVGKQFNIEKPGMDQDMLEEEENYGGDKRPVSILDEVYYTWQDLPVPLRKSDVIVQNKRIEIDAEFDTVVYWKQRAMQLERQLEASVQREQILMDKLQESIKNLERQSSPVEELSQILKRADNFLHFILQNAPVVIGHQDKELRYRFIYNHFPSLQEEDIIGKTDVEIFTGSGVKESQDFKREVMEKGLPAKKEITFETELFGSKTFLIYVEPVFSKAGETIGINYMGMEITDQVRKRERMAKLREEIAVQKAKETELNKTIHITEETMRAKQMLATMSHEIRSPLSGVVSMAEILSTTKLDREQRQLLGVMISSGDLVLQLINDILDLSKVESGVMKLEATKFRPREVVKHVLQTAAASLQKMLTLEGNVADDIPVESNTCMVFYQTKILHCCCLTYSVIGDVLRIRQILTNLVSNAVKFTHHGKVGINLYVVPEPPFAKEEGHQKMSTEHECSMNGDTEEQTHSTETTVWIRCDVYDTGIGIPEKAIPTLFRRYMQVSADHARKYGGTGLGLAICKQLVELMGGHLTVASKEHCGSTFTFILPYKVSTACDNSDDPDELSDVDDTDDDTTEGFFQFQPRTLGSLFSSNGPTRPQNILPDSSQHKEGMTLGTMSSEPQQTCHQVKTDLTSQWVSSTNNNDTSSEVTKSALKPKILLVEDNKINVMVTQSMMKRLGYSMDVVHNGVEAVRAVQRHSYDVILMDVYMPVMNGLQTTKLIRSYEETGNWEAASKAGIEPCLPTSHECSVLPKNRIHIIAMTANTLSESAEECYATGMDSFVSKPVTFQKLKDCLEQYLR